MQPTIEPDPNSGRSPQYGYNILNSKGQVDIKVYIGNIITELTVFPDGNMFQSDDETRVKKKDLEKSILDALQRI